MDSRLQEQIDNYHSGRMTPDEVTSFESQLSSDPSLKAESDLQKEIIDGLSHYRKTQLKARLDAVDLTPSWIEFAQQSTLMKSFGGVAVATLIGTGVFFYAEKGEDLNTISSIEIDAPQYEKPEVIWNLGLEEIEKEEQVREESSSRQAQTLSIVESKSEEIVKEDNANETFDSKEESKTQAFTPSFEAPSANSVDDEEAMDVSGLDELPEESAAEVNETPINVETEITKNIVVKYKYYDGKLFLSGDFDRAPYEILEINSASGRRIYVRYLNKYYKVGVTDKLSELPVVSDTEVIAELDLLRQNK